MLDFIERLADATGLPVGTKSTVGEIAFWHELARQMRHSGRAPDFIRLFLNRHNGHGHHDD